MANANLGLTKVTGSIASLMKQLLITPNITKSKNATYATLPAAVGEAILKIAGKKESMEKLQASDYALYCEVLALRAMLTLFGPDCQFTAKADRTNGNRLTGLIPVKLGLGSPRAKKIFVERFGREDLWTDDVKFCIYLGQSVLPLVLAPRDPDGDDDEWSWLTPNFGVEQSVPVFSVVLTELEVGTNIRIAGFNAFAIKGTSTTKGKLGFSGRIDSIVSIEGGQIKDKFKPIQIMNAMRNPENAAEMIKPASFGGVMVSPFTATVFGIYPIVKYSKETRSTDDGDGRSWINSNVTVNTSEGEQTFRISGSDASAFDSTIQDLYLFTDENGTEYSPAMAWFSGKRAIAYTGTSQNTVKGTVYTNAQLSLVDWDDEIAYIAKPGEEFNYSTGRFCAAGDDEITLLADEDDEDDENQDMGEVFAAQAQMATMASLVINTDEDEDDDAPVAVAVAKKKKAVVAIAEEEDDLAVDM